MRCWECGGFFLFLRNNSKGRSGWVGGTRPCTMCNVYGIVGRGDEDDIEIDNSETILGLECKYFRQLAAVTHV